MECINCNATTVGTINFTGKILHVCGNNCAISYQKKWRRDNFIKRFTMIQEELIKIIKYKLDKDMEKIWKKVIICLNIVKDSIQKIETRKVTEKKYDMILAQFHIVMEMYVNTNSQVYFQVCSFARSIDEFKDKILSLCQG